MTERSGRPEELRASDDDRERAAERVRVAAAEGRIDLTELDQRLTQVYESRTRAELERLNGDLPEPASPVAGGEPAARFAVSLFGWFSRRDRWVAPPELTAVSLFGGGRLDLSEAALTGRVTRIRAFALWGGMGIVVPGEAQVEVRGLGLFGLFGKRAAQSGKPGAPRIVISGLALWGAVVTKTKTRGDRPPAR